MPKRCHRMKCNMVRSRLRGCGDKIVHPPAGARSGADFSSRKITVIGTQKCKRESSTRSGKGVKCAFEKYSRGFAPDPVSTPFTIPLSPSQLSSSSPDQRFVAPLSKTNRPHSHQQSTTRCKNVAFHSVTGIGQKSAPVKARCTLRSRNPPDKLLENTGQTH